MPSAIEEVKLWRRAGGGLPAQATYPEAASQTFKRGDFVYLASGKVTEARAPGNNLIDSGNTPIGIAAANASGTTDEDCVVILLTEDLEICLPVTHATAASAITAITQVGTAYELENVTDKGYAYAIDDTGNPMVKVTAISEQYPVGEQYGWAWVKVIAAERALN
jgi:hypothetical protein